jgi:hypothetical protein
MCKAMRRVAQRLPKKEANKGYARMKGEKKVYLFFTSLDMFNYFIMIG